MHTKEGIYTVKSGNWLVRLHGNDHIAIAPPGCVDGFWNKLWNLGCPPKLHHFL